MKGQIDLITSGGVVEGWCWDDQAPTERVTVAIWVDDEEVGRTLATHYREDLQQAGIGDGCHFLRFVLPESVLGRNRAQIVRLINAATGQSVGDSCTFRAERALTFDERLSELETRNQLLEGRLAELARSYSRNGGQAELFAVVGAYFERLSHDLARGIAPTPEAQLSDAVQALTRTHPPLGFRAVRAPALSVMVDASCPLDQIYACLKALRRAAGGMDLGVTMLDAGLFDEATLLPALVRGVRYVRTNADLVSEWEEAVGVETSPILLFLSGQAIVTERFLAEIIAVFDAHPRTGAVGGCAVDPDGPILSGGLRIVDGELEDIVVSEDGEEAYPVQALSHHAAAFRSTALKAVGGLDPTFGDDLGAALVDLCCRLQESGWSITCVPRATFSMLPGSAESGSKPPATGHSRASDLLRQRWLNPLRDAHSPPDSGA